MEDREARARDVQNQLHQLDMESRGSALTPGEAEKNRDQRAALEAELRELAQPASAAGAAGGAATVNTAGDA